MSLPVPIEFLVVLSLILDLFLIFLLFLFIRRAGRLKPASCGVPESEMAQICEDLRQEANAAAKEALTQASGMIEPVLQSSQEAALEFDRLVKEKQQLTRKLDQSLDSKLISINLLLSRANKLYSQLENQHNTLLNSHPERTLSLFHKEKDVIDQQQQIIDLYLRKMDIDSIAERLSIPKGEVQLVIDLKEKFIAMENA